MWQKQTFGHPIFLLLESDLNIKLSAKFNKFWTAKSDPP